MCRDSKKVGQHCFKLFRSYFKVQSIKSFVYEEWNRNGDVDTQGKTKVKKETEVLKYNGKNYTFDTKDKMRFLRNVNE